MFQEASTESTETTTFTVDGAPYIELTLDLTTTQDAITAHGTETGGFSYTSSDGRFGTCLIDVEYDIVNTETSLDVSITGEICGQSADAFETLGY